MPYRDPEKKREYERNRQRRVREAARGSQAGRLSPLAPLPVEFKLDTAKRALELLEEQIREVRAAAVDPLDRARCVGYLVGVALRAIETGDMAARLEEVERLLRERSAA